MTITGRGGGPIPAHKDRRAPGPAGQATAPHTPETIINTTGQIPVSPDVRRAWNQRHADAINQAAADLGVPLISPATLHPSGIVLPARICDPGERGPWGVIAKSGNDGVTLYVDTVQDTNGDDEFQYAGPLTSRSAVLRAAMYGPLPEPETTPARPAGDDAARRLAVIERLIPPLTQTSDPRASLTATAIHEIARGARSPEEAVRSFVPELADALL